MSERKAPSVLLRGLPFVLPICHSPLGRAGRSTGAGPDRPSEVSAQECASIASHDSRPARSYPCGQGQAARRAALHRYPGTDSAGGCDDAVNAAENHVALEAELDQTIPLVYADPDRALEVFINHLTDNAIRFTPPEGAVTVKASMVETDPSAVLSVGQ